MASEQTPRPLEQMEPLTDEELADLRMALTLRIGRSGGSSFEVLTLRLVASEEGRRRGAASMKEMANDFVDRHFVVCGDRLRTDLTTLLAQVRAQAMEEAAGIAHKAQSTVCGMAPIDTTLPKRIQEILEQQRATMLRVAAEIEAAIRRAATEG